MPLEIDLNEPWNAYHADALRAGLGLCPDPNGFVGNNYPPLSFYLDRRDCAFHGLDPLYVGRALSAARDPGDCAGHLLHDPPIPWIETLRDSRRAPVLCDARALLRRNMSGANDPNLVTLALMACALAWLLRRKAAGRAPELAIALLVIAGFFKHNMVTIPLTAIGWLALSDLRAATRAALVGVGLSAFGLALCPGRSSATCSFSNC